MSTISSFCVGRRLSEENKAVKSVFDWIYKNHADYLQMNLIIFILTSFAVKASKS